MKTNDVCAEQVSIQKGSRVVLRQQCKVKIKLKVHRYRKMLQGSVGEEGIWWQNLARTISPKAVNYIFDVVANT